MQEPQVHYTPRIHDDVIDIIKTSCYDHNMKSIQITVRNVDPLLKRRIDKLAKLKSMSINDFVLTTLQDKVGGAPPAETIDWQSYSGLIDAKGINQSALDEFGEIDPAMWKDN